MTASLRPGPEMTACNSEGAPPRPADAVAPACVAPGGAIGSESWPKIELAANGLPNSAKASANRAAVLAATAALSHMSLLVSAIDSLVEVSSITHCRQSSFLYDDQTGLLRRGNQLPCQH